MKLQPIDIYVITKDDCAHCDKQIANVLGVVDDLEEYYLQKCQLNVSILDETSEIPSDIKTYLDSKDGYPKTLMLNEDGKFVLNIGVMSKNKINDVLDDMLYSDDYCDDDDDYDDYCDEDAYCDDYVKEEDEKSN